LIVEEAGSSACRRLLRADPGIGGNRDAAKVNDFTDFTGDVPVELIRIELTASRVRFLK
jgi:hypothetical protein